MLAELSKAADAEGGPKFLHIVVKLADIESVYFNTSTGRELHAGQDAARPKSALTAALADSPKKSQDVGNRCARLPAPAGPDLNPPGANPTSGQELLCLSIIFWKGDHP